MRWELSLPSSAVSTLLVLVLDVIALWLAEAAFARISAFLTAREVYEKRRSVSISDVWFEGMTGRSHGPMWFRRTQVAVKIFMLAASVTVGLSIDGFTRPREVSLPGQVVLVRRQRTMESSGINFTAGKLSGELLFVKQTYDCVLAEMNTTSRKSVYTYWNARSLLSTTNRTFWKPQNVQCLSPRRGFREPPILRTENFVVNSGACELQLPTRSEIRRDPASGRRVNVTGCPWRVGMAFCSARYDGACVVNLELNGEQALHAARYNGNERHSGTDRAEYRSWLRRDAEALQLMVMYADLTLSPDPAELEHLVGVQTEFRNLTQYSGSRFATGVNSEVFLVGFAIIAIILVFFLTCAVAALYLMRSKNRADYALSMRFSEVARFAKSGHTDIEGETLFVKLHTDFPEVCVSGNAANPGLWEERQVLSKATK